MLNICICTTPIRPEPTNFPPFGSLAVIQALRKQGHNVDFFNIDFHRYSEDQIEQWFQEKKFDLVGISAVVSTAYRYTKYLASLIKKLRPEATIVVGGNLAASAETLLRKCEIDFCVVGDGEKIICELAHYLDTNPGTPLMMPENIRGLCFLDRDRFLFTGYAEKPAAAEISWPDFKILEQDGSLDHFFPPLAQHEDFTHLVVDDCLSPKVATVVMAKGCVARCTFCHRWEKGFRARPVDQIIDHICYLKVHYNVRAIDIADENFGADKNLTYELVEKLGRLNIAWRCAGVRARTVTSDSLHHWRKNGCVAVYFGTESGSQAILDVMEKNTTVEQNLAALRWTGEEGLKTVIQLVIGMPGETNQTIAETIDFLKAVAPYQTSWDEGIPSEQISINYAQALPGTPLYEWAREHGFIGLTLDAEEDYLIGISDTDAYAEDHFLNYTGLPTLNVLVWRPWILAEIDAQHLRKSLGKNSVSLIFLINYYFRSVYSTLASKIKNRTYSFLSRRRFDSAIKNRDSLQTKAESGYFNLARGIKFGPLLLNPVTERLFFLLLGLAVGMKKAKSLVHFFQLLGEYLLFKLNLSSPSQVLAEIPRKSLRKVVQIQPNQGDGLIVSDADNMLPLRKGR